MALQAGNVGGFESLVLMLKKEVGCGDVSCNSSTRVMQRLLDPWSPLPCQSRIQSGLNLVRNTVSKNKSHRGRCQIAISGFHICLHRQVQPHI